jgi:hypothetical protein
VRCPPDHLEYTSEAGADALGRRGTVAVLLPGAFYFLREKQHAAPGSAAAPSRADRDRHRPQSGISLR